MRDAHLTTGPKRYYEELDEAISLIAEMYSGANRQGSVGAWSWSFGDTVIAEAWLHATKPGWWVRIAKKVKRCPFCGETPKVTIRKDLALTNSDKVYWYRIYCMDCDIGMEWPWPWETVLAKWNKRYKE